MKGGVFQILASVWRFDLAVSGRLILYPIVFLAALEAALLGLNPSFYTDDSPEFITVAATLGVAHPPGYPLYMLLGRLLFLLPLPVCFGVNLLSALLGALICLLLLDLLHREFQIPLLVSLAFSFLWMAGFSAYPSALCAKRGIYEMASVFLLAILACLLEGRTKPALFLYGLSWTGHWMTMLAYAPGLVFLGYLGFLRGNASRKTILQWAGFFFAGLSVYLYLPLRAALEPAVNWGYPARLELFLNHLSRHVDSGRDFTSDPAGWFGALGLYLRMAFAEFHGVGLLALMGLFLEWRRNRVRAMGFAAAWVGLVAAICVFSNFSWKRQPIFEDYSVSSWALLALFSGLGAWGLLQKWGRGAALAGIWGVLLLALSLGGVGYRISQNSQTHYTCIYDYALNAWKPLPRDAFFFCQGDELQFPAWYFQWVERRRTDLCVMGSSLSMDWNRIRLERDHPGIKVPNARHDSSTVYDFSPLFPVMAANNPSRRFYFSIPPKQEGMSQFLTAPVGLGWEGAPAPKEPDFDRVSWDRFWNTVRLRHLQAIPGSQDSRSWHSVLQDYGAKRLAAALYEMDRGGRSESLGRKGEAVEWYRQCLRDLMVAKDWNPPGFDEALNGQFVSGHRIDKGEMADLAFHRNALITLGVAHFHLGDMEEARRWIQQATLGLPSDADVQFYAGLAAFQTGNSSEAEKRMKKALALDPRHSQAESLLNYMSRKPEEVPRFSDEQESSKAWPRGN